MNLGKSSASDAIIPSKKGSCLMHLHRVQTKLQHYENLPHVFWAFACEPENGSFLGDVIDGIAFVLEA